MARRSASGKPVGVVVLAPIHEPEIMSFGVSVPTTSSTVTLAVGDALALCAARRACFLNGKGQGLPDIFHRFHPGGAIGSDHQS